MWRLFAHSLWTGLSLLALVGCTANPAQPSVQSPTSATFSTTVPILTLMPTPTGIPTSTAIPQIRITPLIPGENPWHVLAADQSPVVKLLTAHPTQPGWIYAVTGEDGNLIVSKTRGSKWEVSDLSGIDLVRAAPTDPMVVYAIAKQRTSVWRSDNGGQNFRRLRAPLMDRLTLAVAHSGADMIYLAGNSSSGDVPLGSELFRSDDGGKTWVRLTQLPVRMGFKGDLLVDPTEEGHLYATLSEGSISEERAFESWDGGVSWKAVESLNHLTPMKWTLTQGQSPTAFLAVAAGRSDSQVPSYVAAEPKTVRFPLPEATPVEVFPSEQFPEFGEFMVLDAMFSDPDVAIGRYMGGTYGGAILLTQDGGDAWLRLDTAGWMVGGILYHKALVRELALVATNPLRVIAVVHWPLELQGLWMLELGTPDIQARSAFDRIMSGSYRK